MSHKKASEAYSVKWYLKLLLSGILPLFSAIFLITLIVEFKGKFSVNIFDAIKYAFSDIYMGIDILMFLLGTMIFFARDQLHKWTMLNDKFDIYWKTHLKQDRDQLNEIIGNAKIVLQIDIEAFSSDHIKVIQDILDHLNSLEVNNIIAIDASQPSQWWTNSMLGYLAIQARWASYSKARKVHRFFILNRGELSSLSGKKIIQMHALLGFETYIILEPFFDKLYKKYSEDNKTVFGKKECFVWEDPSSNPATTTLPKKFIGRNIYGYQSFWLTDTPYGKRKTETQINIKGDKIVDLTNKSEYQIKFEYFTDAYKNYADEFYKFTQYLIQQSHCCHDGDDVTKVWDKNKVIHIPSERKVNQAGVITTKSIDIDIVSEIIDKYVQYCDIINNK